jgi:hypothetical protein
MATFEELKAVKRRHSADLRRLPGVCGVDIDKDADGEHVLTVHLDTKDPSIRRSLPEHVEGHPVKYVVSGPFKKQ